MAFIRSILSSSFNYSHSIFRSSGHVAQRFTPRFFNFSHSNVPPINNPTQISTSSDSSSRQSSNNWHVPFSSFKFISVGMGGVAANLILKKESDEERFNRILGGFIPTAEASELDDEELEESWSQSFLNMAVKSVAWILCNEMAITLGKGQDLREYELLLSNLLRLKIIPSSAEIVAREIIKSTNKIPSIPSHQQLSEIKKKNLELLKIIESESSKIMSPSFSGHKIVPIFGVLNDIENHLDSENKFIHFETKQRLRKIKKDLERARDSMLFPYKSMLTEDQKLDRIQVLKRMHNSYQKNAQSGMEKFLIQVQLIERLDTKRMQTIEKNPLQNWQISPWSTPFLIRTAHLASNRSMSTEARKYSLK